MQLGVPYGVWLGTLMCMAELLTSVETELDTDFAILGARQLGSSLSVGEFFAVSTPGTVTMQCGYKYAKVRIDLERWDAPPPLIDGWEDQDDLPFAEISGAGELTVTGFDETEVGLSVDGLGRGRVQVFARGRHRYDYGSNVDTSLLDPEEWLIRIYPTDLPPDPLRGGPKRIAAARPANLPTDAWQASVRGFASMGWSDALVASHGFYLAHSALSSASAPQTREELAASMLRRMPPWQVGGPDSLTVAVPPHLSLRGAADPLAAASGQPDILTVGDAIEALITLGLLVIQKRDARELLVPNPSPEPAWSRLELTGSALVASRYRGLRHLHYEVATDISHAVAWAWPAGLSASPRRLALRWSTSVSDIIGGLQMLGGTGEVTTDQGLGFDSELDPDAELTLRAGNSSLYA